MLQQSIISDFNNILQINTEFEAHEKANPPEKLFFSTAYDTFSVSIDGRSLDHGGLWQSRKRYPNDERLDQIESYKIAVDTCLNEMLRGKQIAEHDASQDGQ